MALASSSGSGFPLSSSSSEIKEDINSGVSPEDPNSGAVMKILSYNVWFKDLEMDKRMEAIGDLIQQHSPDIICFQEVTRKIYDILCQSSWWEVYECSVSNDMVQREKRQFFCLQLSKLQVKAFSSKPLRKKELCIAEVKVQDEKNLVVATSHLQSSYRRRSKERRSKDAKERVEQAREAINLLENNQNVIFCGDMNWDDKLDGRFPCTEGWVDAWTKLRPRKNGWTYNTKSNQMLSRKRTTKMRLDRFICNLRDFKISGIDVIGKEAISGLSYCKEMKVRKKTRKLELPVLPSDHYGLLLTINSQLC